jgi:hypothetical protein
MVGPAGGAVTSQEVGAMVAVGSLLVPGLGEIEGALLPGGVAAELAIVRQGYVAAISDLSAAGSSLRAAGAGSEELAVAMHAERRAIGEEFKALTSTDRLGEIYQRNLIKYGDKLGPSIDWLRGQGKTWGQIIESAGRTGGKDLGF